MCLQNSHFLVTVLKFTFLVDNSPPTPPQNCSLFIPQVSTLPVLGAGDSSEWDKKIPALTEFAFWWGDRQWTQQLFKANKIWDRSRGHLESYFRGLVREGFSEELILRLSPEWQDRAGQKTWWCLVGKEKSKCKIQREGYWKVPGTEGMWTPRIWWREVGNEIREVGRPQMVLNTGGSQNGVWVLF